MHSSWEILLEHALCACCEVTRAFYIKNVERDPDRSERNLALLKENCQWPPSFTPRAFPTGVPCSSSRHNFAQYTYSVPLFRSCNNKLLITKHPSSRSIKMMSSCVSNWLRKSSLNVFLSIACVSISLGSTSSMVTRTGFPLAYK